MSTLPQALGSVGHSGFILVAENDIPTAHGNHLPFV
jgi:hypothetical protein